MVPDDRVPRNPAHETNERDCCRPPKNRSNFAKIENFYHFDSFSLPYVPFKPDVEKPKKGPVLCGFGGKVLAGWFFPSRTERLLLGKWRNK
jgi:hypothetical protein